MSEDRRPRHRRDLMGKGRITALLMLYIYTVLCHVYLTHHNGIIRDLNRIQDTAPTNGMLTLEADPVNAPNALKARLLRDDGTDVIPYLRYARVIAIRVRGLRIVGSEVIARRGNAKSRVDYYDQSWIVKPF